MIENLIDEIWKNIEGYEGLYQISNLGRVKSLPRNTTSGKLLKPRKHKDGYLFTNLCKEGKLKTFTIHRLVANAFIPNPDNLLEVNHRDENKENNFVENLEWCNRKYNVNFGSRNQRHSEKLSNRKDQSKKVFQYSKELNLIKVWPSTAECRRNGFNQGNVAACCRGLLKHYKGYF